jgi:hypothetical protein
MGFPADHIVGYDSVLALAAEKMDGGKQQKTTEVMIRPLRNIHRRLWLCLALILPAGIIFSWLVIPNPVAIHKMAAVQPTLLPEIKGKKETALYCINIRSGADKIAWQLEWKSKLPLAVPSAVIYQAKNYVYQPGDAKLVGRVEARGNYVFPLSRDNDSVLLLLVYDFIHARIIDSAKFRFL